MQVSSKQRIVVVQLELECGNVMMVSVQCNSGLRACVALLRRLHAGEPLCLLNPIHRQQNCYRVSRCYSNRVYDVLLGGETSSARRFRNHATKHETHPYKHCHLTRGGQTMKKSLS